MSRRVLMFILSVLLAGSAATLASQQQQQQQTIEVYQGPTCSCCTKWIDHLRGHGFAVRTTNTDNLNDVKARHGVPPQLRTCHTALVSGYVIEGHVPAADVERLLNERPAVLGLAVAGMPIGSPGMEPVTLRLVARETPPGSPRAEVPILKAEPYDVVAFDKDGGTRVFATYGR
jgi:hypothetical protein